VSRLRAAAARIGALPVVPTLAVLGALQLTQGFWFAFSTPHNGWIWNSGGDATEYWTGQWAVGHGIIPQAIIGYALPVYYGWVPHVTGTTLFEGAPVIVLLQAIVLVPLALVLFWLVADRLFGRVYAWCAAALWVAGPLLLLHGFVSRYHATFDQNFLVPHWFGFTNMADLPSMVAVLACVWLALRWLDTGSGTDAVLGGLVLGLALGLKPSNGFIVPPLVVLVACARRPRQAALWLASVVPALVTLALWKVRGLGNLPLTSTSLGSVRSATGSSPVLALTTSKYVQFDWHHLNEELKDLREVFWSLRFLEFLIVAGAFGVIRKSPLRGTFVVLWFVSYGIFKGSSTHSDFTNTNWFRLAEPGIPAYILLAVGVVYCLPGVGRRVASLRPALPDGLAFNRRKVAAPAVLLALVPLVVLAAASPASSMRTVRDNTHVNEAPLSDAFHLQVSGVAGGVHLTWDAIPSGRSRASYEVLRTTNGDGCNQPDTGAAECFLKMDQVNVLRETTFVDHPPPGRYAYRIGMLGGYRRSSESGDLMLLTRDAATIRVR
jgi:hypothetical protein